MIKGKEYLMLHKFLDDLGNVLPMETRIFNEYRAEKGTSLRRPVFGECSLTLADEQFSSITLRYFPEDWKWGEPHKIMRERIYLNSVSLRNPLPQLSKKGYNLLGNVEIKEKIGFRKSRIVGYLFRAVKKENKSLEERLNSDQALLKALNDEFSTGKGRPLPDVGVGGKIYPLGGFDIFNIDRQREKVSDTDFWKINDPDTPKRLISRLNALRKLAKYLMESEVATPPKPVRKRTVLWDTTHHETLRFFDSESHLVKMLQETLKIPWGPIREEKCLDEKILLDWPAVLVLGGIESWFPAGEIRNIVKFVETGGALLIIAPATGRSLSDINKVAAHFGFRFSSGCVYDTVNYEGGHEDHAIIRDFKSHPITEGLKEISFGDFGGTTIKPKKEEKGVEQLAFTSDKAKPAKAPVLACVSMGKGKVVAFGCSTTFEDKNIVKLDNLKFARNLFEYLSGLEPIVTVPTPTVPEEAEPKPTVPHPPALTLRFCAYCGKKLKPEDLYCWNCGKKVEK